MACLCTVIALIVFGSDKISEFVNMFLTNCANALIYKDINARVYKMIFYSFLWVIILLPIIAAFYGN